MHCKECNLRSEVQACLVSSQCRFVSSRFSFHYELNAISCIEFGLVIFGDDPKVQDMRPWFNAIQGSVLACEHAH